MSKPIKIEIEGKPVWVKKGFKNEWRVVYPPRDEDGKWNWFNALVGGYGNLLFIVVMVIVAIAIILMMRAQIMEANNAIHRAYEVCPMAFPNNMHLNTSIPNLNFTPKT